MSESIDMPDIYRRPALANEIAKALLTPGVLDQRLRSGLFMSGLRRIGKTTFLLNDLIPALEERGAIVIYLDLWSESGRRPDEMIKEAVKAKLRELQTPGSATLEALKRIGGIEAGFAGFKLGIKIDQVGERGGDTLAKALKKVVDSTKASVVMIIDEVQHAVTADEGGGLKELKAARDAINLSPKTPGYFLLVGTGSHRALVAEMTARRNQAFQGAASEAFPTLDEGYVKFLLTQLGKEWRGKPSQAVALQAFEMLGGRPEEFLKTLAAVKAAVLRGDGKADALLPIYARAQRAAAGDAELRKLDSLGPLAGAVFGRIASEVGEAKGLFAEAAVKAYGVALGRQVKAEEVQQAVHDLMGENLVMRRGHGTYLVTDPFVQEVWREQEGVRRVLDRD